MCFVWIRKIAALPKTPITRPGTYLSKNRGVLWLTPLFPVDYTRVTARGSIRALYSRSFRRHQPAWFQGTGKIRRSENTRGRLGHNEPLESVGRVSLQKRLDQLAGLGIAWLVCKLVAMLLRNATPGSTSWRASASDVTRPAIPLHRDPWCGTHVSPEISFPFEQLGQMMHFCSAECRIRYQQSSQRAASA